MPHSSTTAMALGLGTALALAAAPAEAAKYNVLNFWGMGGFYSGAHRSATTFMDSLPKVIDMTVDKSDDAAVFTTANLAKYQVLVLNNVTEIGKVLNDDRKAALLEFMKKKGVVAIYGSADTKGSWSEYSTFLGGEFSSHGKGDAKMNLECSNSKHPLLSGLPSQTNMDEKWYAYKTNPRLSPGVQVLLTLDESTCATCTRMPGGDHPIAWTKLNAEGGRLFYMAMSHFDQAGQKDDFSRNMLKNAILWAGGEGVASVEPNSSGCATGIGTTVVEIEPKGANEIRLHRLDGRLRGHSGPNFAPSVEIRKQGRR